MGTIFRKQSTRLFSTILSLLLIIAMMPVNALADGGGNTQNGPEKIILTITEDGMTQIGDQFYGVKGESFVAKAVDETGKETPVTWDTTDFCKQWVDVDANTGKYTIKENEPSGGSKALYIIARSKLNGKEGEISRYVNGWAFSKWGVEKTITLSEDGQKEKSESLSAGIEGSNLWFWDIKGEVAKVKGEVGNEKKITFIAKRPGKFTAGFKIKDKESLTDTANFTVEGLAVEDGSGQNGKLYMSIGKGNINSKLTLKAFCQENRHVTKWDSSNEEVALVDAEGVVTTKKVGTVIITATDNEGTKGGIKIVVESEDKPYFEKIEFLTNPLTSESWNNETTFKSDKLEYDIEYKIATASKLTMLGGTAYNTDKYNAVLSYTDSNGEAKKIKVNNGKITFIDNIPFGKSVLKIILTDKNNEKNETIYIFNVIRPREAVGGKLSKPNWSGKGGLTIQPVGRELNNTKYKGYEEGTIFQIKEDDESVLGVGISDDCTAYGAMMQDGLREFKVELDTVSDYAHIRYSEDEGNTWVEMPSLGGGVTAPFSFVKAGKDKVKIAIEIITDSAYYKNIADGKHGFEDGVKTYNLSVRRLSEENQAKITELTTDKGEIYVTGNNYKIYVPFGSEAPVLSIRVNKGSVLKNGDAEIKPNGEGVILYTAEKYGKTLKVISENGDLEKEYKVSYSERSEGAPDKIVDFLCVNSQYTNGGGWGSGYGVNPETLLSNSMKSLGNFGGYVTVYYKNPITDNPNNKYGVDMYIFGNAAVNTSTADKKSFFEPGQVWISEDGTKWYALAGSEHYEKTTIKNYSVTYRKTDDGKTAWTDNLGNSNDGKSKSGPYPLASLYSSCDYVKKDSFTLSGILLPASDGTVLGDGNSSAGMVRWGYVDALANNDKGTDVNPYGEVNIEDQSKTLKCAGFDLAWAVDEEGIPVDTSNKEFHYVKVVTASNIWHNAFNEKSTEVSSFYIPKATEQAVGKTEIKGITVTDGANRKSINFEAGKNEYSLDIGDIKYASISVEGISKSGNIYVNNQRIGESGKAEGIKVTKEGGDTLVRILAQEGEKEPDIKVVRLKSAATESDELIDGIKVNAGGKVTSLKTADGINYKFSVGHKIEEISIKPIISVDTDCTVNGGKPEDSYRLKDGNNKFEIKAEKNQKVQTIIVEITKEKAPAPSGKNITVYFALFGDKIHGNDGEVHVFKNEPHKFEKWIEKQAYTVPLEATVLDVFEQALREHKYSWENPDGNYISSINGLAEFSNGPNSGWMYTLNGTHPLKGVAEQNLVDGDTIIFHYTDDYTQEEGSEKWNTTPGEEEITKVVTRKEKGGSANITVAPTVVKLEDGTAKISLKPEHEAEILKQAAEHKSGEVILKVNVSDVKGSKDMIAELNRDFVKSLTEKTEAMLKLNSPVGDISLDKKAMEAVVRDGNNVILHIREISSPKEEHKKLAGDKAKFYDVRIKAGNEEITDFAGGILRLKLEIPQEIPVNKAAAVWVKKDNSLEQMLGEVIKEASRNFYEFKTDHLATYAVVDADKAIGEILSSEELGQDEVQNRERIKSIKLKAYVKYTKNGKIRVIAEVTKGKKAIQLMRKSGLTVEYKLYRSAEKNGKYKTVMIKSKPVFSIVRGKSGRTYYYKLSVIFKNQAGETVGKTGLKQCKAASTERKKAS